MKIEDVITFSYVLPIGRKSEMNWAGEGHVALHESDRWTKKILYWKPREHKRSVGRPPKCSKAKIGRCWY